MMRSPVRALISPLCTRLFSYRVGCFVRPTASAARGPPPRDPATGSLRRVTARSPEWRARDAVWFLRMHATVRHGGLLELTVTPTAAGRPTHWVADGARVAAGALASRHPDERHLSVSRVAVVRD